MDILWKVNKLVDTELIPSESLKELIKLIKKS